MKKSLIPVVPIPAIAFGCKLIIPGLSPDFYPMLSAMLLRGSITEQKRKIINDS